MLHVLFHQLHCMWERRGNWINHLITYTADSLPHNFLNAQNDRHLKACLTPVGVDFIGFTLKHCLLKIDPNTVRLCPLFRVWKRSGPLDEAFEVAAVAAVPCWGGRERCWANRSAVSASSALSSGRKDQTVDWTRSWPAPEWLPARKKLNRRLERILDSRGLQAVKY